MKITRSGLAAIACSVALLWGCILAERMELNRAYAERDAVMRTVRPGSRNVETVRGGKRVLPMKSRLQRG